MRTESLADRLPFAGMWFLWIIGLAWGVMPDRGAVGEWTAGWRGTGTGAGQQSVAQAPAAQDLGSEEATATLRQRSLEKWRADIDQLLLTPPATLDPTVEASDRSIVFYGSSSIRLWDSIATDVAPLMPTRRGFGGAKSLDLAVFATEVLTAQTYDGLVIFVANDISGEADQPEYSPDQVIGWLEEVVAVSRAWQPTAPILLVEVTPTPKRWEVWPRQLALNLRLREWTLNQPGLEFLATAEYFLDAQGQVREELFDADRLHLNSDGYRLWGRLIRRRVLEWSEPVR